MVWVDSSNIEGCWHPEYFSPVYEAIEEILTDSSINKVRLEELLAQAQRQPITGREDEIAWLARLKLGAVNIEEVATATDYLPGTALLTRPAVVVGRNVGKGLSTAYWGEDVFQGTGAAAPEVIALTPKSEYDAAWLTAEMQSPFFQLQVRRSTIGSVVPQLSKEQLISLWVRVPPAEEQRRLGERVRQRLAIDHAKIAIEAAQSDQPQFVITGATFEERLRQFDDYLLEQAWVDRDAAFFVEASTRDAKSDLFVIRPLAKERSGSDVSGRGDYQLRPQDDRGTAKAWRDWYWSSEEQWRIFNALVGVDDLPAYLQARMVNRFAGSPPGRGIDISLLPGFGIWRDIIESKRAVADEEGLGPATWQQIISEWLNVANLQRQEGIRSNLKSEREFEPDETTGLSEWLRNVYRPALILKVFRDEQIIGAYVVFGQDQADEPQRVRAQLEGYGTSLRNTLRLTPEAVAEAARRESLRRLSSFSHSLGGPLLRIASVLDDLEGLLSSRPELEQELIPNRIIAERRSRMPGRLLEEFTLGARLRVIRQAVSEMKNVAEQIKRLKRVEGELRLGLVDVANLLLDRAQHCRSEHQNLIIIVDSMLDSILTMADYDALMAAIDQVLANACREMKERNVERPTLNLHVETIGRNIIMSIRDNGLPADAELIENPFAEDSSSYFTSGKGSGFGLVIVRQVFRSLGGNCTLRENYADGERVDGVTFEAKFPLRHPIGER